MRRILAGIAAGALVGGGAVAGTAPLAAYGARERPGPAMVLRVPAEAADCAVAYTLTAGWPGGFLAEVRIANLGVRAVTGWNLAFELPPGQAVGTAWGMLHSQHGPSVTLSNAAFNGTVPPGGTVVAALRVASRAGSGIARPAGFTLNGRACRLD